MIAVPDSCKVYTPAKLAAAMVGAIARDEQRWLEPSFGKGVFLEELARRGVRRSNLIAVELDAEWALADELATTYRGVDALRLIPALGARFDAIVGNPPYIGFSLVDPEMRAAATALELPGSRQRLPGNANLWIAFVYASLAVLEAGGSMCFVLPAAYEYAAYAEPLRRALPNLFAKVKVIRSRRPLFPEVQDGCVILLATGFGFSNVSVSRVLCSDIDEVCRELSSTEAQLHVQELVDTVAPRFSGGCKFGDLAKIRLGGVTGDSKYFVLTEQKRVDLKLPPEACVPVLTKARHLCVPDMYKRTWDELRRAGEPVWLFRPKDHLLRSKWVRRYLDMGESGECNTAAQKIRTRDQWYRTPMPARAHAFLTARVSEQFAFTFNRSLDVSATNTLYVVEFDPTLSWQRRYAIGVAFFSSVVRDQLRRLARSYSAGLVKVEPGDLARICVPEIPDGVDFRGVYTRMFHENPVDRQVLADKIFAQGVHPKTGVRVHFLNRAMRPVS